MVLLSGHCCCDHNLMSSWEEMPTDRILPTGHQDTMAVLATVHQSCLGWSLPTVRILLGLWKGVNGQMNHLLVRYSMNANEYCLIPTNLSPITPCQTKIKDPC